MCTQALLIVVCPLGTVGQLRRRVDLREERSSLPPALDRTLYPSGPLADRPRRCSLQDAIDSFVMAFSPISLLLRLLPVVAGLLIPAYATVASIESPGTQDDTQYLIYWLLYSVVSLVEFLFWPVLKVLGGLYFLAKTVALLWLVLPQTKGATYVYEAILRPTLKKSGEEARKVGLAFPQLPET